MALIQTNSPGNSGGIVGQIDADNGLHLNSSSGNTTVYLGGTLLENTLIAGANKTFTLNNANQVLIALGASATVGNPITLQSGTTEINVNKNQDINLNTNAANMPIDLNANDGKINLTSAGTGHWVRVVNGILSMGNNDDGLDKVIIRTDYITGTTQRAQQIANVGGTFVMTVNGAGADTAGNVVIAAAAQNLMEVLLEGDDAGGLNIVNVGAITCDELTAGVQIETGTLLVNTGITIFNSSINLNGKTFTLSNTLTLSGTDGSTLNIGTGGTLGTAAFVADSTLVHLAGIETISGAKTFSTFITVQGGVFAIQTTTGTAIGISAGAAKRTGATGSDDVFIGYNSGISIPDGQTFHTFVGAYTGGNATAGAGSTAVGQKAFVNSTTIQQSVAVGGKAGSSLTNAQSEVFVGYAAAQFATATNLGRRTFIGYNAGQYDNGDYNIAIGYTAGSQVTSGSPAGNPTTGQMNIAIGHGSMNTLNGGARNVGLGPACFSSLTSGGSNVGIGYQALNAITAGINNVAIGDGAGSTHTGSRCIIIGASANLPGTNLQNIFVAGASGNERIDNVFFGKGYTNATPTAYTINGTGGSGTDIAGGDLNLAGGKGTNQGATGKINLQTAPAAGSSGTTLNALVTCAQFDANTTAAETRFLLYDIDAGTLKRVSIGAADSGGTGFKVLRVVN